MPATTTGCGIPPREGRFPGPSTRSSAAWTFHRETCRSRVAQPVRARAGRRSGVLLQELNGTAATSRRPHLAIIPPSTALVSPAAPPHSARQYLGSDGSTSRDQASMPPDEVVQVLEPGVLEVLGRRLAADPVMALEDDAGAAVEAHQAIVALLIEQAGTGDCRDRPLLWRADVDELERLAAVHHLLEIRGCELLNGHGRSSHDPRVI